MWLKEDPYLSYLFRPRSIAVIGASKTPGKMGYEVLTNIVKYGFQGPIFPVNPKYNEIHDIRCYRTVLDITDDIDLAILVSPIERIPKILGELEAKGVKVAVIISGKRRDLSSLPIAEYARKYDIRILGPSSMGIFHARSKLNATLGPPSVMEGSIGLVTESRTLGMALMGLAKMEGIGLSTVVGLGDKLDINESDILSFLMRDRSTRSIIMHLESIRDPNSLINILKSSISSKPVVILSSASDVREKLKDLNEYVPIVGDIMQALDAALALAGKRIKGNRVLVVTNSGGAGKLIAGLSNQTKIEFPHPSEDLMDQVRQFVPEGGICSANPIDITGRAGTDIYRGVLDASLSSDDFDGILAIYCETALSDPLRLADMFSELWELYEKPIIPVIMGGERSKEAVLQLRLKGIPAYFSPCRAMRSIDFLVKISPFSSV